MSPRIMGLMLIAAQIALYFLARQILLGENKYSAGVYITATLVLWLAAFANLWVLLKAVLLITGWQ